MAHNAFTLERKRAWCLAEIGIQFVVPDNTTAASLRSGFINNYRYPSNGNMLTSDRQHSRRRGSIKAVLSYSSAQQTKAQSDLGNEVTTMNTHG